MAYKKKEPKPKTFFPQDYPGFKVIKTFKKLRSPRTKMFATGEKDGWFVDVFELKSRTGEVVDNEGWITKTQVEEWTSWYKNMGWEEVKI